MTTTYRDTYLSDMSEPEPAGHFVMSNGRRKRARYRGDRRVFAQTTVEPTDPKKAAEAAALNARHKKVFGRG